MSDAIQLLKDDHREVEALFEQFGQSGDPEIALKICEELTVHATLEEELVYPLYRSKVDTGAADEARHEHQEAKDTITQIEAAISAGDDDALKSLVTKLQASIEHHVEEEESELFPKLQSKIPDNADHLGNDIVARKEELLAGLADDKEIGLNPSTSGQKPTAAPNP